MRTIVCDTDFLIKISNDPLPKLDWAKLSRENEFVALSSIVRELQGLVRNTSVKTRKRAALALQVIEKGDKIKIISSGRNQREDADNALVRFVSEMPKERMLATMDGSLLSRLERMHLPYLTLSGGKALIHEGREQYI